MDQVIKRISEIEAAASSIMDDAGTRKKAFATEMEQKTTAFDLTLDEATEKQIQTLRDQMEIELNKKLEQQRADANFILQQMEDNYNLHHATYATQLFQSFIEE